jgi:hypothetical protein
MSPIEDSPAIDSRTSRDLAVVPALCDEALDCLDFSERMQGRHLRPCQEPYNEVLTLIVPIGSEQATSKGRGGYARSEELP